MVAVGKAARDMPSVSNIVEHLTPSSGAVKAAGDLVPFGVGAAFEAATNAVDDALKTAGAVGGGEAGVLAAGAGCEAVTP